MVKVITKDDRLEDFQSYEIQRSYAGETGKSKANIQPVQRLGMISIQGTYLHIFSLDHPCSGRPLVLHPLPVKGLKYNEEINTNLSERKATCISAI